MTGVQRSQTAWKIAKNKKENEACRTIRPKPTRKLDQDLRDAAEAVGLIQVDQTLDLMARMQGQVNQD